MKSKVTQITISNTHKIIALDSKERSYINKTQVLYYSKILGSNGSKYI